MHKLQSTLAIVQNFFHVDRRQKQHLSTKKRLSKLKNL